MRSQEHLPCFWRSLQKTSKALMLWQLSFKRHDVRIKRSLLHTLCFCVDVLHICVYNIMVTGTFFSTDLFQFSDFFPHFKLSTLQTASTENSWTGTCKCGMKKTTRIVGGSETEVSQAKYDCTKEISFFTQNFSNTMWLSTAGEWVSMDCLLRLQWSERTESWRMRCYPGQLFLLHIL